MAGELLNYFPKSVSERVDESYGQVATLLCDSCFFGEHDDPSNTLSGFLDPHIYVGRASRANFREVQEWSRLSMFGGLLSCDTSQLSTTRISGRYILEAWKSWDKVDPMGDFLASLGKTYGEDMLEAQDTVTYFTLFSGAWCHLVSKGNASIGQITKKPKVPLLENYNMS